MPVKVVKPVTCKTPVPASVFVPKSKLPYNLVAVVDELPITVVFEPNPVVLLPITIWLVWLSAKGFVKYPNITLLFKIVADVTPSAI